MTLTIYMLILKCLDVDGQTLNLMLCFSGFFQKVPSSSNQQEVALSPLTKNIQEKSTRKHTTAAAQARQERLVHSVTHREKGIEVTKIGRARRTSWT